MKKPATKVAPAKTEAAATTEKKPVNRTLVDRYIAYNHAGRFPFTQVQHDTRAALDANPPKLVRHAYMLTKGTKGLLCLSVMSDEKGEFVARKSGEKETYSHLPTLHKLEKGLKVEILTVKELLARALHGKTKTRLFKNRASGEEVPVVLLNAVTDSYFVGLTIAEDGALRVINMEPPAKYNKKADQWVLLKEVSDGKLVTKLTNYTSKASKALLGK